MLMLQLMTDPHEIEEQRETEGPVEGTAHVVAVDQLVQTSPRTEIKYHSRTRFVAQDTQQAVDVLMAQWAQLQTQQQQQ